MIAKDITHLVSFHNNDDELLPIVRCACGARFKPWEFSISIYPDAPYRCPICNRAMFFTVEITVYEVSSDVEINQ